MSAPSSTNVAIACQGGGSHTAFTAGALKHLLREQGSDYRISALSGTSGGALCAFIAWYGLRTGTHEKAISSLDTLWETVAATTPSERIANTSLVWGSRLLEMGFPVWQIPPSINMFSEIGQRALREMLESFVDAQPLDDLILDCLPADADRPLPTKLLVSAVDANDGSFGVFTDRPELEPIPNELTGVESTPHPLSDYIEEIPQPISIDAVVASTAVPTLYEGVKLPETEETTHTYWDGLFSQNPPLRNLLSGPGSKEQKPNEIWLVRINPTYQAGPFTTLEEIADRRNELAGNLSLYQELFFINRVNQWLADGKFTEEFSANHKPVTVRQIALIEADLDPQHELTPSSKLDRDPELLTDLKSAGEKQARNFLENKEQYVIIE